MIGTHDAHQQGMGTGSKAFELAYGANATLLLCHEVDSARWAEWDLFHLPFGAAGFVLLHVPLVALVLAGGWSVARAAPSARWWSVALGAVGLVGAGIHITFLATGDSRFAEPVSVALIAAFAVTSAVQLWLTSKRWKKTAVP